MNIPLPDNGIPIKLGDTSYIYKNVYNPITWVNDEPYRPRVETLIIKNGELVYLYMKDKNKGSSGVRGDYELPGGSIDADSTSIQQAENEVNEEALMSIKDIYDTGIQYYENYPGGFIMGGGDTPLEYKGHISNVYIAKYSGIYDRRAVEEKDLDDKIASNGRFYRIPEVATKLKKEHITAILNSPYVKPHIKGALRILAQMNGDKVKQDIKQLTPVKETTGQLLFVSGVDKTKTNLITTRHLSKKRISVFGTIENAVSHYDVETNGSVRNGMILHVYAINDDNVSLYTPSNEESPSAKITGELWVKTDKPVDISHLGMIQIKTDGSLGHFYIGKRSEIKKEVIKCKFKWLVKEVTRRPILEMNTVVPGNKLYHGSTYEITSFEPRSLDLGNVMEEPGWSTFAFADYNLALRFGMMRAIQKAKDYFGKDITCTWDIMEKKPFISASDYRKIANLIQGFVFYVYTIDVTNLEVGIGNDDRLPEYTFRESGVVPEETEELRIDTPMIQNHLLIIPDEDIEEKIKSQECMARYHHVRGWYSCMITRDYNGGEASHQLQKAVSDGKLQPGDNVQEYMITNGISFGDDSIKMVDAVQETNVLNKLDTKFTTKGTKLLSSLKKLPITDSTIKSYKKQFKFLSHVRTGDNIKGYLYTDGVDCAIISVETKQNGVKWIQALEISKGLQGYGLSRQLLTIATKELGATYLSVNKKNEVAYNLYKKFGFIVDSETDSMYYMTTNSASPVQESGTSYKSKLVKDFENKSPMKLSSFKKFPLTKTTIKMYKDQTNHFEHIGPSARGYLFIDGENLVAFVIVEPPEKDGTGDLSSYTWITDIEVTPRYRGHGLSRQLLDIAVKDLKGDFLTVTYDNEVAINLYKSCGFKIGKNSYDEVKSGKSKSKMYTMFYKDCYPENMEFVNESAYYRVEYDGAGIYDAVATNVDNDTWRKILQSEDVKWLPKPPSYAGNNKSYFTENGYQMFVRKTLPLLKPYLDESKIELRKYSSIDDDIMYQDKYQIVTEGVQPKITFASGKEYVVEIIDSLPMSEKKLIGNHVDEGFARQFAEKTKNLKDREVLLVDGVPIAFLDVYTMPGMKDNEGTIVLATRRGEQYRRKGYGSILVKRMEERIAEKAGVTKLKWEYDNVNVKSGMMGISLGYKKMKRGVLTKTLESVNITESTPMQESVIETVNDSQSEEPIFEVAEYSSVNRYPVFIILMHTGTTLATMIKKVTKDEFSHAGISFDAKLSMIYSFGTKKFGEFENGFTQQTLDNEFMHHYKTKFAVYVMFVSKEQREKMYNRLQYFIDNEETLKYDLASLIPCFLKIPTEFRKKYFCSRFVMDVIGSGQELSKVPSLWTPQQIAGLDNVSLVNAGLDLHRYDYKITNKNLELIKQGKQDQITTTIPVTEAAMTGVSKYTGFYSDSAWNGIAIVNGEKYRHRVECIILKGGQIFLGTKKDGSVIVPGGSVEKGIPNEVQCANECKEEARIIVKNMMFTGIAYMDRTGMPRWAIEKNLPMEWVGHYTEIYVAEYDKKYTGYVKDMDIDPVMSKGKFYDISSVKSKLRPEWVEAIDKYRSINQEFILSEVIQFNEKLNQMEYIIPNKGNIIYEIKKSDFVNYYYALSPKEFEKYGGGICWDYTIYEGNYFKTNFKQIPFKTFYVNIITGIRQSATHTFLLFYHDENVYWFESSWKPMRGIRQFKSEKDALNCIVNALVKVQTNNGLTVRNVDIIQYDTLDRNIIGLGCTEFMSYMSRLPRYNFVFKNKYQSMPEPITPVEPLPVTEACKNLNDARKFVYEVGKLAKKYDANYFIVTDGASGTHTDGAGSSNVIRAAREHHKEWERAHNFDPDEDWTSSMESVTEGEIVETGHFKTYMNLADLDSARKPVTKSWVSLMEAAEDDDEGESTEDGNTSTDYTKDVDDSDTEDTASTDDGEDESTDYTENVDNEEESEQDTDEDTSNDDEENTDKPDQDNTEDSLEEPTDYTEDTTEDSESSSNDPSPDNNANPYDNNVLKNYSLLNNFEKLYELTKEVSDSLDAEVEPTEIQNKVLAQVLRNLNSIKEFIISYVKFQFSKDNYSQNFYYYSIAVQALNLNLKLLKKNKDLGIPK